MAKTLVAIFESYDNAEKAAYEIREKGLRSDNISIIVKDYYKSYNHKKNRNGIISNKDNIIISLRSGRRERVIDGIITGGILGGIVGIAIGAGSIFIPGLDVFAAASPITGLVFGLIAGGLVGGIVDIQLPRYKKREFKRLISCGNAFFSMKVDDDRIEQISVIVKDNGALIVEKY